LGVDDVSLMPSSGGAFEVSVNDRVVFSKLNEGRFPDEGEVEEKISQLLR